MNINISRKNINLKQFNRQLPLPTLDCHNYQWNGGEGGMWIMCRPMRLSWHYVQIRDCGPKSRSCAVLFYILSIQCHLGRVNFVRPSKVIYKAVAGSQLINYKRYCSWSVKPIITTTVIFSMQLALLSTCCYIIAQLTSSTELRAKIKTSNVFRNDHICCMTFTGVRFPEGSGINNGKWECCQVLLIQKHSVGGHFQKCSRHYFLL